MSTVLPALRLSAKKAGTQRVPAKVACSKTAGLFIIALTNTGSQHCAQPAQTPVGLLSEIVTNPHPIHPRRVVG